MRLLTDDLSPGKKNKNLSAHSRKIDQITDRSPHIIKIGNKAGFWNMVNWQGEAANLLREKFINMYLMAAILLSRSPWHLFNTIFYIFYS